MDGNGSGWGGEECMIKPCIFIPATRTDRTMSSGVAANYYPLTEVFTPG